ncbi:MAG: hypothetical protein WCC66_06090 [Rhizobiaceae bacterium]
MDWPLAINRNREALQRIVAALFMMAAAALTAPGLSRRSLGEGGRGPVSLPRHIYAAILLILRPAESAVRRLITIAAKDLAFKPRAPRLAPVGLPAFPVAGASRTPAFALLDPLKQFTRDDFDVSAGSALSAAFASLFEPAFPTPSAYKSDEPVDAAQLYARLRALRHALSDLPRQARRLARWQARRDQALAENRPTRITPFRPGLPPGWRQRSIHEIDEVLRECHGLALYAVNGPDTG